MRIRNGISWLVFMQKFYLWTSFIIWASKWDVPLNGISLSEAGLFLGADPNLGTGHILGASLRLGAGQIPETGRLVGQYTMYQHITWIASGHPVTTC